MVIMQGKNAWRRKVIFMKIAIIDKDAVNRQQLAQMISGCLVRGDPDRTYIEVSEYEDGLQALNTFSHMRFAGIFISVESIEDFEAAWKLHNIDKKCRMVFMSTSNEFSVISYRLKVVHYLQKPIETEQVEEALRRLKTEQT